MHKHHISRVKDQAARLQAMTAAKTYSALFLLAALALLLCCIGGPADAAGRKYERTTGRCPYKPGRQENREEPPSHQGRRPMRLWMISSGIWASSLLPLLKREFGNLWSGTGGITGSEQ